MVPYKFHQSDIIYDKCMIDLMIPKCREKQNCKEELREEEREKQRGEREKERGRFILGYVPSQNVMSSPALAERG